MAVTRSTATDRADARSHGRRAIVWRRSEAFWMLAASLVLICGFYLVYQAKSRPFGEIDKGLAV